MAHHPDPARGAGDSGETLVRVGGVVFAIGAIATLVTVTPLLIGAEPLPTPAYLVSMLMGVGFAIAGAGLLRSVAEQRRQARRAQAGSSG
ncbi:hypothetical protein [Streptomyces sp. 7-21]|uniref:hypothetical protein n=1 Tax=Streptomyces sp. 7-21 TaxID=2802283 RepID=UPI00191E4D3D|nr:hypothetical protein [Streptomyces sp. 7-21]MBL1067540.1 hypothetical protein [Streptomyces sp. 7-21]